MRQNSPANASAGRTTNRSIRCLNTERPNLTVSRELYTHHKCNIVLRAHIVNKVSKQADYHQEPKGNKELTYNCVQIISAALQHGAPRFLLNTHLVPLD